MSKDVTFLSTLGMGLSAICGKTPAVGIETIGQLILLQDAEH